MAIQFDNKIIANVKILLYILHFTDLPSYSSLAHLC